MYETSLVHISWTDVSLTSHGIRAVSFSGWLWFEGFSYVLVMLNELNNNAVEYIFYPCF